MVAAWKAKLLPSLQRERAGGKEPSQTLTFLWPCRHTDGRRLPPAVQPGMKAIPNHRRAFSTCCAANVQGRGIHQLAQHIIKDRRFFPVRFGKLYITSSVISHWPTRDLAGQSSFHASQWRVRVDVETLIEFKDLKEAFFDGMS